MKVNTSSWSYRFNSWCDGSIDSMIEKMNSCQYIRYTAKNILLGFVQSLLALIVIGGVLFSAFWILVGVVGYFALILGPFIGYSDFFIRHNIYDYAAFLTLFGSVAAIAVGLVLTCDEDIPMNVFPDYMKPNKNIKALKDKTPNVLVQHLKNWHNKVFCTKVEIVKDQ